MCSNNTVPWLPPFRIYSNIRRGHKYSQSVSPDFKICGGRFLPRSEYYSYGKRQKVTRGQGRLSRLPRVQILEHARTSQLIQSSHTHHLANQLSESTSYLQPKVIYFNHLFLSTSDYGLNSSFPCIIKFLSDVDSVCLLSLTLDMSDISLSETPRRHSSEVQTSDKLVIKCLLFL